MLLKRSDAVTRLQALVDRKKIVISEDVIREILQLDDAEGVVCLPNEDIFAGLAQMGYEKPSTKLTFYKAFFSGQWKFFIHTLLQSLGAKRTSWNEFSTAMASAVICISKGQKFNFLKYIFDSLVRNVDNSSKFYMYPRFIQLIIQNQVGDLSTHTTRFISSALTQKENVAEDVAIDAIPSPPSHDIPSLSQKLSSPPQQTQSSPQAPPQGVNFPTHFQQVLDTCSALTRRVENLEHENAAQQLEIIKLKARVKRLERVNKVKSSKLRRLRKVGASRRIESSDDMKDVFNQGRMIDDLDKDEGIDLAEKQAEMYHLDLDHPSKVLSMQEDDSEVQGVVEVVSTAMLITDVVTAASQEMEEEDQEVIKIINETPAQKAAKRRKLNEEAQAAEDLKKRLAVVDDEDDDVFTEATPLARKEKDCDLRGLQLDDAEGVVCLPNEEIFAGLAQMGYEKPSTKLTFYKAFFSGQWKFFIHTLLLVRNVDNSSKFYMYPRFIQLIIQNQVSDLSTHTTRFISSALTQKVFENIRWVGKGFSGVETPLFEGMLAARQLAEEGIAEEQDQADDLVAAAVQENVAEDDVNFPTHFQQVLDTCSALTRRVENLEHENAAQQLEIIKLKARVKRLERVNKVKSSKLRHLRKVGASRRIESSDDMKDVFNQGRMIDDLDKDEGIDLAEIYHLDLDHPSKVLSMQEDNSEVQEVVEVVSTAMLITDVITAASQVSAASATISVAKPSIYAAAPTVVAAYTRRRKKVIIRDLEEELSSKTPGETPKLKDKGKGILIETSKPIKKKDQIELDAKYTRKLHEDINKDIDWDAAIDHVKQKSKNPQYIKRYHGMKKKPQSESEARKNMMIYLKNTAGYKMDFFKGMSYAEICPIFQARFDENMRKLNEEAQAAEDLKKRLAVVDDEDDDVFTEATSLARKVPVVDYQIVLIDNKPRFKIFKADETH
nr:hypothetical protein [Tanacetum cinerariifolium]